MVITNTLQNEIWGRVCGESQKKNPPDPLPVYPSHSGRGAWYGLYLNLLLLRLNEQIQESRFAFNFQKNSPPYTNEAEAPEKSRSIPKYLNI